MVNREYESLIHRYLDGELDASQTLRVEEHLRTSPSSKAYLEEVKLLDQQLSEAFQPLSQVSDESVERIEEEILGRLRSLEVSPETPIRSLESHRRAIRSLRIAAALVMLAIGIQIAVMAFSKTSPQSDEGVLDQLRDRIAQLEEENSRLKKENSGSARKRAPFRPGKAIPVAPGRLAPEPGDPEAGVGPEPEAAAPDKDEVFRNLRLLLSGLQQGKWDESLRNRIFRDLDRLGKLSNEDFRNLQHLFHQQADQTMGQVILAQIISRYFTHDKQAREFIFQQVERDLNQLQAGNGPGDRVLRRAWTEGLMQVYDRRSVDLLYRLGRYELDPYNRMNIYNGLRTIGTSEAALKLARLAAQESNVLLKSGSLEDLHNLILSDPTVGKGIEDDLAALMKEILRGDFGENNVNFDSMVWAIMILRALGHPDAEAMLREWQDRKGGDPRGKKPGGLPLKPK
jgi:hypothetical protein